MQEILGKQIRQTENGYGLGKAAGSVCHIGHLPVLAKIYSQISEVNLIHNYYICFIDCVTSLITLFNFCYCSSDFSCTESPGVSVFLQKITLNLL